jgi:transposase InsO family protein
MGIIGEFNSGAGSSEPDRCWASDITIIKAWNNEKGRHAIVIDCGSRQVIKYL